MRVIPPGAVISSRSRGGDWPVFHPTQLANLHAWWDATQETYANSAAVTGLTNREGTTARNLAQATGANQPTFNTAGINGRAAVSFDGTNDYLTTALNAFTGTTVMTVCAAIRTGSDVTSLHNVLTGVNAAVNAQVAFNLQSSVVTMQGTALAVGGSVAVSTNYRLIYVYNGASAAIYINGTGTTGLTAGSGDIASYRMGADNSVGGPWNGLQGEVVTYSRALTTTEIALVDLYLSRKWGI